MSLADHEDPPPNRHGTPHTVEELGLPSGLVQDLVLRAALVAGRTSTCELSSTLALSPVLVTTMLEELRDLRLVEVHGLERRNYIVALSDEGRRQAKERMELCRYVGPAPVTLASYCEMIGRQHASPAFDLDHLRRAFSDLVVEDGLLERIGPAAMGDGAMFLYGPPGTGKSSIAERLHRVHSDYVLVPHAIEVDHQIISVFDPVVHRAADDQPAGADPRWILCRRPFITVGGELTADMLDLTLQQGSGVYLAPLQMQANNGVLVIDDFGRQALTPEELLNRWIVPLDRSVDFLSLDYGLKFEVPFDAKIVFSTNLEPESLGDEAFFRRIESKVLIPPIGDDQFDEVLRRVAEATGIELADGAPEHLRFTSRSRGDGDLRPYLPGAVCRILRSICTFETRPRRLDHEMVDRIGEMYYTERSDGARCPRIGEPTRTTTAPGVVGEITSLVAS
jgi:hypothetical protein